MVTRQSQNDAPAIDWDEVLTPPEELATAARELIPAVCSLSAVDLEQMAIAIRDRPELWQPLLVVDTFRRRYRLLFEDERTDIWVLCWMPGQSTGFHDHDISDVGIAIAQGMIVERQLRLPTGATSLELRPGDTRQGPAGYIHSVAHGEGAACGLDPLLLAAADEGRAVPRRRRRGAVARRRARSPRARRRDDRTHRPRARLTPALTPLEDYAPEFVVIGGGMGGIACAMRARHLGARVAVIEPEALGGT